MVGSAATAHDARSSFNFQTSVTREGAVYRQLLLMCFELKLYPVDLDLYSRHTNV